MAINGDTWLLVDAWCGWDMISVAVTMRIIAISWYMPPEHDDWMEIHAIVCFAF